MFTDPQRVGPDTESVHPNGSVLPGLAVDDTVMITWIDHRG